MCRLLESIRVENGVCYHLPYHEQRMHRAQRELFGEATITRLSDHIVVPSFAQHGVFKCRIIYRQAIERIEFVPYRYKSIRTLRCIDGDYVDYDHKYEDRRLLNELFAQRGDCDDVLIVKDGRVTDTSYANVIFYDGQRWLTPNQPLLRGTQRQYLLDQGLISERLIRERDLRDFKSFQVINAFRGWSYQILPISYII